MQLDERDQRIAELEAEVAARTVRRDAACKGLARVRRAVLAVGIVFTAIGVAFGFAYGFNRFVPGCFIGYGVVSAGSIPWLHLQRRAAARAVKDSEERRRVRELLG